MKLRSLPHIAVMTAKLSLCLGLLAAGIASGHAQPSGHAEIDQARLWQAYSGRFISGDGRVMDPARNAMTTSEGQSYALFFALVNNDRGRFDQLLNWTVSNLAAGDLGTHLPAWSWGETKDGNWGVLDANSASDSDLWIAYDLIEAGRLWKEPRYATMGRHLASAAARHEVATLPGFGPTLLPGAIGFHLPHAWVVNPSYIPIFLLDRLAAVDPAGPWADVAAMTPVLIERSARGGFEMDWVCYAPGQSFIPCQANGKQTPPPVGSYDAIRVYLWAGMLPSANPARSRILKALPGMNAYLQHYPAPPEKIASDGTAQAQPGPIGFSAALLPYLEDDGDQAVVAQQMVRLKSQLDEKSYLFGTSPTYYDQNLALFGTGWMEKSFEFGNDGELLVRWTR